MDSNPRIRVIGEALEELEQGEGERRRGRIGPRSEPLVRENQIDCAPADWIRCGEGHPEQVLAALEEILLAADPGKAQSSPAQQLSF